MAGASEAHNILVGSLAQPVSAVPVPARAWCIPAVCARPSARPVCTLIRMSSWSAVSPASSMAVRTRCSTLHSPPKSCPHRKPTTAAGNSSITGRSSPCSYYLMVASDRQHYRPLYLYPSARSSLAPDARQPAGNLHRGSIHQLQALHRRAIREGRPERNSAASPLTGRAAPIRSPACSVSASSLRRYCPVLLNRFCESD